MFDVIKALESTNAAGLDRAARAATLSHLLATYRFGRRHLAAVAVESQSVVALANALALLAA